MDFFPRKNPSGKQILKKKQPIQSVVLIEYLSNRKTKALEKYNRKNTTGNNRHIACHSLLKGT